ncbi:MAG: hypothetical protein WCK87_00810 [Candidatus Saccharibacteria bacterium]
MVLLSGRSTNSSIFIRNNKKIIEISSSFFSSLLKISPEILLDDEIALLAELLRDDEKNFEGNTKNNIIPLVEGSKKMRKAAQLYGDLIFYSMYSPKEIWDDFRRIEAKIVKALLDCWAEKYLLDNKYMESLKPGPNPIEESRVAYCACTIDTTKLGDIILDHSAEVMKDELDVSMLRPQLLLKNLGQLRSVASRQTEGWKEVELLANFFGGKGGNTLSPQTTILILSIPNDLAESAMNSQISQAQLYRLQEFKNIFLT